MSDVIETGSKQVVVVLRKLPGYDKEVVTAVRQVPPYKPRPQQEDSEAQQTADFAEAVTKEVRKKFAEQFVEFEKATWRFQLLPLE